MTAAAKKRAVSPRFVAAVASNLRYWQTRRAALSDETLVEWEGEQENVFRAIKAGLACGETQETSVLLLVALFEFAEKQGHWHAWRGLVDQGMAVCQPDWTAVGIQLMIQKGALLHLEHRLDEAIVVLQAARGLAEQHDELIAAGLAHFYLSTSFWKKRAQREAKRHAEAALAIYRTQGVGEDRIKVASLLNIVGLQARERGDLAEAERCFVEAVAAWEQTTEQLYLARSLSNLGLTYCDGGRFGEANVVFDEADGILQRLGAELDRSLLALNQGVAFYQMERWGVAERLFRRANSDFLRRSDNRQLQAAIKNNLGSSLLKQGRLDEAVVWLQESIEQWRGLNDEVMLANSLGDLGEIYLEQQAWPKSRAMLGEAVALLAKYGENAFAVKRLKKVKRLWERAQAEGG